MATDSEGRLTTRETTNSDSIPKWTAMGLRAGATAAAPIRITIEDSRMVNSVIMFDIGLMS